MFKVTYFDKKLCHLLRHHLNLVDENICETYSIWNFYPQTRWRALKNFCSGRHLCRAHNFPLIYWFVLIISTMGSIYSLYEFSSLCWGGRQQLTIWRQRTFYILTPSLLRKCRLVGALLMLSSWLLLCYAVVKVSPNLMTPWLTVNTIVLGFDMLIWMVEVFSGVCKLELCTLFSFTLATVNNLFVRCVQGVFQNAIEMNDVESLILWKKYF